MAKATRKLLTFPTTLDQVSPEPMPHLIAEAAGFRFWLGSYHTIPEAQDALREFVDFYKARGTLNRVSFYAVDRSATHYVNGDRADFMATMTGMEA